MPGTLNKAALEAIGKFHALLLCVICGKELNRRPRCARGVAVTLAHDVLHEQQACDHCGVLWTLTLYIEKKGGTEEGVRHLLTLYGVNMCCKIAVGGVAIVHEGEGTSNLGLPAEVPCAD